MSSSNRLIVAILGSPRIGGNTDLLLDAAARGATEEGARVERLVLNTMSIRPCQNCGGCSTTGKCVIQDDMQRVHELIERMDGMILASPVYFGGLSAQTKAMIDRCQALWSRKHVLKQPMCADGKQRRVLFLSVQGGYSRRQIGAVRTGVKSFIETFDGIYEELFFPRIDAKGEVAEHQTALQQAHGAGRALAHGLPMAGAEQ